MCSSSTLCFQHMSGILEGQSLCFSSCPCRFSRMNNKLRFTAKGHIGLAVTQCFWMQTTFYTLYFEKKKKNTAVNSDKVRSRQSESQQPSVNIETVINSCVWATQKSWIGRKASLQNSHFMTVFNVDITEGSRPCYLSHPHRML